MIADIRERHERFGRRVFNTHLLYSLLPTAKKQDDNDDDDDTFVNIRPKKLYLLRNPLDACLSFYHHLSSQVEGTYTGSFEQFFEDWLNGEIYYGTWMNHALSYAAGIRQATEQEDNDVLVLEYERMVNDLPHCVDQIIHHLELGHLQANKNVVVDELLPTFSFAYMKAHASIFQPKSVGWLNQYQFLRKGIVGDSKSPNGLVTESMRVAFREYLQKTGYVEQIHSIFDTDDYAPVRQPFLDVIRD